MHYGGSSRTTTQSLRRRRGRRLKSSLEPGTPGRQGETGDGDRVRQGTADGKFSDTCRLFFTMVVVSETRKLSFDPFRRVTSLRNAGFFLTFIYFLVHLTLWITAFRVRELVYPERSRRAPAFLF